MPTYPTTQAGSINAVDDRLHAHGDCARIIFEAMATLSTHRVIFEALLLYGADVAAVQSGRLRFDTCVAYCPHLARPCSTISMSKTSSNGALRTKTSAPT